MKNTKTPPPEPKAEIPPPPLVPCNSSQVAELAAEAEHRKLYGEEHRNPPKELVGVYLRCGGCGDFIEVPRCPRCTPTMTVGQPVNNFPVVTAEVK